MNNIRYFGKKSFNNNKFVLIASRNWYSIKESGNPAFVLIVGAMSLAANP
jgi:hypothetical protein